MDIIARRIPGHGRGDRASPAEGLGAAELAWALLQLFAVGGALREAGWCTGELGARDVVLSAAGLRRTTIAGGWRTRALEARRDRHLRDGHDLGCALFGVPLTAVERLVRAWADPRAVDFVLALVRESVAELRRAGIGPHRGWSRAGLDEVVHYVVRARLTPRRPHAR
ncbi:MAG: hypothetical protein J0H64_04015 [Actinobacteria bacterium]|nr:hypothetical protein [Actinomycetota bacterium]